MRILITGGAGFIGNNLGTYLSGKGHDITLYDKEQASLASCAAVQGDILDQAALEQALQGHDAVVHLAAMVSATESVAHPEKAEEINVQGSTTVLAAAQAAGVSRAVLASSAAVYGESPATPTSEVEAAQPVSPYGDSKARMEDVAAASAVSTCCLRIFNVYGPGQKADSQYAAAIPAFITRALNNEPLTIYGDGEQTRDFVYVTDLCRAIELALTKGDGVINIASGNAITISRLAETVIRLADSSSKVVHEPARAGDPRTSLADVTKAKEALGFEASTSMEDGLKETIDWYRNSKSL